MDNFPRLQAVDLSGNNFDKFPPHLPGITQLYLAENPLKVSLLTFFISETLSLYEFQEITTKNLLLVDGLRKVSLGGNKTS